LKTISQNPFKIKSFGIRLRPNRLQIWL